MQSNGGSMTYGLKSTMNLFPLEVAYNDDSVGNIISFFRLIQVSGLVITLDNRVNYGFNVTYLGKLYHFLPFENGLYYFDTRTAPRSVEDNFKDIVSPYLFLQSVEDNKAFCTQNEIKAAENARLQQEALGWPSDDYYKFIIKENLITNTEITLADFERAQHIYRPAKTTTSRSDD